MAAFVDNRQFGMEGSSHGLPKTGHLAGGGGGRKPEFPRSNGVVQRTAFDSRLMKARFEEEEEEEEEEEGIAWEIPKENKNESTGDPRDVGTADEWVKRNPELVRLTGRHPFNCEPPLCRLMQHGFLTPASLHYVRNHGSVPRASWEEWRVEVCGLVKRPAQLSMRQLVEEFAPRQLPVTLVCAGNRRKEQNLVKQTIGFSWGAGGVSTSLWRGARLVDVLRRCGIMGKKKGALYVCFEGAEDLPGGGGSKYGTSVAVDVAMDEGRDLLLAYMQNGEVLQPDHGFPVRMIIPGFIGGRMVKWLRRIVVTSKESDNYYHHKDNRVLPSHIDAEAANSEGWWYRPEYIINELNINSVITTPSHDEILPINSATTQRPYTLKGYAYSGGGRKVTRVEVTFNGGETWNLCALNHPEKPTKYGKHWCWCFWELDVEVMELLATKEIAVRAWDETMNTQPKDLTWNVMGMMNNCWFRVKMNVCKPHHGEIGLLFEHPTRPGNQSGGWMAREKLKESTEQHTNSVMKKSSSTPMMNTAALRHITLPEVEKHNSAESAWIVVDRHVYDCTMFLKDHPGGRDSILINAGSDSSEEFNAIHSTKAKAMLENYRIGELVGSLGGVGYLSSPDSSLHGGSKALRCLASISEVPISKPVALHPKQNITCRLVGKKVVSPDTRLFTFALPSPDQVLGLPTGKHVFLSAHINDKLCMRAYTPVSSDDEVGYFQLLVKIYFKGVNPNFPEGGLMSQYLEGLSVGDGSINVKGPVGHIQYHGMGNFTINGQTKFAKQIAMLAGGTGITPLYQVIKAILKDPEDNTQIYLVYANRSEDDILLREELDQWSRDSKLHPNFHIWYVISKSVREGWNYSLGYMREEILRDHLPEGSCSQTIALMCGPPPMIQLACLPALKKLNYDTHNSCFQF